MKRICSIGSGLAFAYLVAGYLFIVLTGTFIRHIEEYENETV